MKFLRNFNNKTRGGTKLQKQILKAGVLSIVMVLAVVLTLVFKPQSASAVAILYGNYGNYVYEVSDNEATITGYTGQDSDISIPSSINGYKVTKIADRAFYSGNNPSSLVNVVIPDGVTSIGTYAFLNCYKLTSVTIPNSVNTIGNAVFCNCWSLTGITIPNALVNIGDYVFASCTSLESIEVGSENAEYTSVDGVFYNKSKTTLIQYPAKRTATAFAVPEGVAIIKGGAFACCENLISITIPNSVTSIGVGAFNTCRSLTSIIIPNGVTNLENSVLNNCTSLSSVTIPSTIESIGSYAFSNCTSLKSITIPNSVIYIGESAFKACRSLESITIPNSVTYIGGAAFEECVKLKNITLPSNLASICMYTFNGCSSLESIIIPNSITDIGGAAFQDCTSLKSITIPSNLVSIGDYTFEQCSSLKSITIPNSVTNIGQRAFEDCTSLESITIPSNLTSIGAEAFNGCSSLTSVRFLGNAPTVGDEANGYNYLGSCSESLRVYYLYNKTGFTNPWCGFTTVAGYITPVNFNVSAIKDSSINTTWSPVTEASGYELYRCTTSEGIYEKVIDTTATSYTNTGLVIGTTYYYKVRSYKIVGTTTYYSDYSTIGSAKPIPAAPTNPKSISSGYNSINISWSAVAGATGYELFRATAGVTVSKIADVTALSYNNTGLATGTTYYYKIRAYKLVGTTRVYSDYSTVVNAKPILTAPVSPKSVSSGYNSINISWSAVIGASGYELFRATAGAAVSKIADVTTLTYNNIGLATGTTYYYKLRAYRIVGTMRVYSDYSTVVNAKSILTAPASPKSVSSGYNSVNISWSAVAGASGYELFRATAGAAVSKIADVTTLSYNNIGLATGTTYYYKVRAYRIVGTTRVYSDYSTVVNAKPIPAAPTNLKVVRASATSINTSWSAVSGATGYMVFRATSSTGTYSAVKDTTALNYVNTGLTKGVTYYYKVVAYRTVGTTRVYSGFTPVAFAKTY